MSQDTEVPVIIVTGGSRAGKSSLMRLIEERQGSEVWIMPEVATLLLPGFSQPGVALDYGPSWARAFQPAIMETIFRMEEVYRTAAKRKGARGIVMDRGPLDGAGFWPDGPDAFLMRFFGPSSRGYRSERYAKIVHLESSVAYQEDCDLKAGNTLRYESNAAQIIASEMLIKEVYQRHPAWTFIAGRESFEDKIEAAYAEVEAAFRH